MKFFGMIILLVLLMNLYGCYSVVYHSEDSEDSEILYSGPIYIPVLIPYPVPMPMPFPAPPPQNIPTVPPNEKIRHDDNSGNDRNDSYTNRDPIRDQGGRGTGERSSQGR